MFTTCLCKQKFKVFGVVHLTHKHNFVENAEANLQHLKSRYAVMPVNTKYTAEEQQTIYAAQKTTLYILLISSKVECSWNVMAHGDAREGKWRGNWRMEWVASTLHTTSEHGVSSITTADAHTSAVSSRLNWRPRRFKWTRPFRRKTKSCFCACAITFQTVYWITTCVMYFNGV
jgi:arabinogalactan endo-1,4-beta-galactosidase